MDGVMDMSLNKSLKPIYWHEGLFLRPQHLQQQDIFLRQYCYELQNLHKSELWGVIALDINDATLKNDVIEIHSFDLLFQDGARVNNKNNSMIPRRNFEFHWPEKGELISVYLGLKKIHYGLKNVQKSEWSTDDTEYAESADDEKSEIKNSVFKRARYHIPDNPTDIYDLFENDQSSGVYFLDYQLSIIFGDELDLADDFELIKIAEISRPGNNKRLSTQYIPPVLTIQASAVLYQALLKLREQCVYQSRELALHNGNAHFGQASSGSSQVNLLLLLVLLNRFTARLDVMLNDETTAPVLIFNEIRQVIAELSSFTNRFDMFGSTTSLVEPLHSSSPQTGSVIDYNHKDLAGCFHIIETLHNLLRELSLHPHYVFSLNYDGDKYVADLCDEIFFSEKEYYLCFTVNKADQVLSDEHFAENIRRNLKVATVEEIDVLVAHSIPGVDCRYELTARVELQSLPNKYYFKLDVSNKYWDQIKQKKNIAVYSNEKLHFSTIELMVINGH